MTTTDDMTATLVKFFTDEVAYLSADLLRMDPLVNVRGYADRARELEYARGRLAELRAQGEQP